MDSHLTSDKNDPKLIHNSNETALNSDSMASAHNNSSSKKLSATSSNDNEVITSKQMGNRKSKEIIFNLLIFSKLWSASWL